MRFIRHSLSPLIKVIKKGTKLEKSLLRNHFLALLILIIATASVYLVQNKMLNAQKDIALLVNTSGKQRMASQKLFRILYENAREIKRDSKNQISSVHKIIIENHKILLHKLLFEKGSVSYNNKQLYALYFEEDGLDKMLSDFDEELCKFIDSNQNINTLDWLLDNYGQKLLDKFEFAVEVYQIESEKKVSELMKLESTLTALMIVLILFEGYFIFRPAIAAVYRENLLLKKHQLNLERKIEKEIKKRQEQEAILIQKAKLAEMGEMLNNIAHQWKQPLNIVSLITGSIKESLKSYKDPQIDEDIETMIDQIRFMSSTIDTFRNFYQPDRRAVQFNLITAIKSVEKILQIELKQKRIEFVAKGENLLVYGYENEFKQIILNLITNAKDSIAEAINRGLIDYGEIEFDISKNGNFAEIIARDNGMGISASVKQKIFNPYFTTKLSSNGTGIGLYMIRTILERHFAGSIELVQPADRGAVFVIRIALQNSSLCL